MRTTSGDQSEAASRNQNSHEKIRTGLGADAIAEALIDNLHFLQAKLPQHATRNDWYMALAYTVRDRMLDRYIETLGALVEAQKPIKAVAYLSAEFLTGPHLGNSLINLGIWQATEKAVAQVDKGDLGAWLEQLVESMKEGFERLELLELERINFCENEDAERWGSSKVNVGHTISHTQF
jgi:hypothetical protein